MADSDEQKGDREADFLRRGAHQWTIWNSHEGSTSSATSYASLTATLTATRGEQRWTLANNYELSIMMNSASMDGGGRWWTQVPLFR